MLHGKFQDHQTFGSEVKDFRRFLPYVSGGSIQKTLIGQAVSEKNMFDCNGRIHVFSSGAGKDNPLGQLFS